MFSLATHRERPPPAHVRPRNKTGVYLLLLAGALGACHHAAARRPDTTQARPSDLSTATMGWGPPGRGLDMCPLTEPVEQKRAEYLTSIGGCLDDTPADFAPTQSRATDAETRPLRAALYCQTTPLDACFAKMDAVWPASQAPYRYEVSAEGRVLGAWPLVAPPDDAVTCCVRRAARQLTLPPPGRALTFDDGLREIVPLCGNGSASGTGLIKEEIKEVITQTDPLIRACYETGIAKRPGLEGRVTLRFVIAADGSVAGVTVKSYTVTADVACCISQVARQWRFSQPRGVPHVAVEYPFVLELYRGQ